LNSKEILLLFIDYYNIIIMQLPVWVVHIHLYGIRRIYQPQQRLMLSLHCNNDH
jgi:hypothetical protein